MHKLFKMFNCLLHYFSEEYPIDDLGLNITPVIMPMTLQAVYMSQQLVCVCVLNVLRARLLPSLSDSILIQDDVFHFTKLISAITSF